MANILDKTSYNICPICKQEYWDDEIAKEKAINSNVYCEWGVDSNGNVLYGYGCNNGHLWLEVRETMGSRHRHPGFGGASGYHDVNQKHGNSKYRHRLPKNMD